MVDREIKMIDGRTASIFTARAGYMFQTILTISGKHPYSRSWLKNNVAAVNAKAMEMIARYEKKKA